MEDTTEVKDENLGQGGKHKKRKKIIQRTDKIGYTYDDEDYHTGKGKKNPAHSTTKVNQMFHKLKTDGGRCKDCQTIVVIGVFGLLLCGGGTALILLIVDLPDLKDVVGPLLVGMGGVLVIACFCLSVRWCVIRKGQVSDEVDDNFDASSVNYEMTCNNSKITVEDILRQSPPGTVNLYGQEEALDSRMRRGTISSRLDADDIEANIAAIYKDDILPNAIVTLPQNAGDGSEEECPTYTHEWKAHNV